jgi:hypothetical protein
MAAETKAQQNDEKQQKEKECVVRQLDGLAANTTRSLQALEGRFSAGEHQRILEAVEGAKKIKARPDATLDDLRNALREMEKAAAIIGQAVLRP